MRKTKSHEYLLKHSQERSEKYPGNYIAIVEDELVGVSSSEHEVFEKVILNISLNMQCIYYESNSRFLHIDPSHKDGTIGYKMKNVVTMHLPEEVIKELEDIAR
jgi:hypothetical protein